MARESRDLWRSGAALTAIALLGFLLTGCDIPGYKPHKVASADSATASDTQASFASSVVDKPAAPAKPVVTAPVAFEDAESAFRAGRYDEAVTLFTAYTAQKATNAWGHYMLGLASWKSGDGDKAETEFTKALAIDSTHVKSWLNLGRVELDAGRPAAGLDKAGRALALDPTSVDAFRLIGRAKSALGDIGDAITAYNHALALDDKDVWTLNNVGLMYIEQDWPGDAVGPLARAVDVRPDVAVFHNNLGMALELTGYFSAAEDQYRMALTIDSTHTRAAANLARLMGRGDRDGLPPLDLPAEVQRFLAGLK